MGCFVVKRVLIANRGEIAVRIARACRTVGMAPVGIYTDEDTHALHIEMMDAAAYIGQGMAYLDIDAVINAATELGAWAVHPGYGFLAEEAEFAKRCAAAGLIFVGPPVSAMEIMGKKSAAREVAEKAGVPVVRGGVWQGDATLADAIGYPVLIKASGGGGGRGMRVARTPEKLPLQIDAAKREAKAAFGDDTLLLEKFIQRARHVEVQILGDTHGRLLHLFDRDCSLQRRHQKLIEEAPAPGLSDATRDALHDAALKLAGAVGYYNAGTVEFLLNKDNPEEFYFLEMNTRLQVEHPVTEAITGIDIAAWQLRIAAGEKLTIDQESVRAAGHAIEARICAENAWQGHLPVTGTVQRLHYSEGLRSDGGLREGQSIGSTYDSLLAKVISFAPNRAEATAKLREGLRRLVILGCETNSGYLAAALEHEDFIGDAHTTDSLQQWGLTEDPIMLTNAALCAAVIFAHQRSGPLAFIEADWRNVGEAQHRERLRLALESYTVDSRPGALRLNDGAWQEYRCLRLTADQALIDFNGVARSVDFAREGELLHLHLAGSGNYTVERLPRFDGSGRGADKGTVFSVMPGKVLKLCVDVGDAVRKGQALLVLEAMKMENVVHAGVDGNVQELFVNEGQQVKSGHPLAKIATEV